MKAALSEAVTGRSSADADGDGICPGLMPVPLLHRTGEPFGNLSFGATVGLVEGTEEADDEPDETEPEPPQAARSTAIAKPATKAEDIADTLRGRSGFLNAGPAADTPRSTDDARAR